MSPYKDDVTISELLRTRVGSSTQDDAAEALGVRQAQVSRWIRGVDVPTAKRVPALAAYLDEPEERIVRALHAQRVKASVDARLDVLEVQVAELRDGVAQLQKALRRGRGTR